MKLVKINFEIAIFAQKKKYFKSWFFGQKLDIYNSVKSAACILWSLGGFPIVQSSLILLRPNLLIPVWGDSIFSQIGLQKIPLAM